MLSPDEDAEGNFRLMKEKGHKNTSTLRQFCLSFKMSQVL